MSRLRQVKNISITRFAPMLALALFPGVLLLALLLLTDLVAHTDAVGMAPPDIATVTATPDSAHRDIVRLPEGTSTAVWARTTPAAVNVVTPTTISPTPASPSPTQRTAVAPTVTPTMMDSPTTVPATVAPPTVVPVDQTSTPGTYAAITRLLIPRIDVDAAVEVKSLDPDGVMQTPGAPDVVSWYDFSSQPVDEGNAVFAGHLDYAGYGPAVFWRLDELGPEDVIEVHQQDGTILRYRVTSVRPFAATDDASGIVASAGRPTITLITCDGAFDSENRSYDERLVVTGDRID